MPLTCAEYSRRYREKHPERVRTLQREWAKKDREKKRRDRVELFGTLAILTINRAVAVLPLNGGRRALVDTVDLDSLPRCKWYTSNLGYVCAHVQSGTTLLHRIIVSVPPGFVIDHKNGNGLDNRRCNLRVTTQTLNMANQYKIRGKVPFKGVCRVGDKFYAQIRLKGKNFSLGTFSDPEAAAKAYDDRAKVLFGEFARTNESLGLLKTHGGVKS